MGNLPPFSKEQKVMLGLKLVNLIRQRNTIASQIQKDKLEKKIAESRIEMKEALKEAGYF
ncbi:MAG: hypothetical protein PHG05_02025 [Candidatus Nanoarchaeia archaeon]|nr:hypothetical protein [Candidatus Nanoarchaeia archaeon]